MLNHWEKMFIILIYDKELVSRKYFKSLKMQHKNVKKKIKTWASEVSIMAQQRQI